MKKVVLLLTLICAATFAGTNTLVLTWSQPPDYASTLYYSTNLAGTWSPISTNPPPYTTIETNPVSFFTVVVAPQTQFAGGTDPTNINAVPGSTYVNTNTADFWINQTGGTNGWIFKIVGY